MNAQLESYGGETAVTPTLPQTNPRYRILVVEDDADIRRLSAEALRRSGYQVDEAEDGAAGWEALQAKTYDLLITDHNMPGLSGLELVKKARSTRMTLLVIMVSGALLAEELGRYPWLNFAATMTKPFSSEHLLATVKVALSVPDDAHHRAGIAFPFATSDGRQSMPPPRWGLNE